MRSRRSNAASPRARRPSPAGTPHRSSTVLGDITDAAAVAAAVDGHDAVVHLAAKVGVTGTRDEYVRANVDGTRALLAAARAAGVSRFVHVSSPSVAHGGAALVAAAAEPADPVDHAWPLRHHQGRGRAARTRRRRRRLRRRRHPAAPGVGTRRHPARRTHRRPGPPGPPRPRRFGRGAHRHHLHRQRRRCPRRRARPGARR